MTEERPAAAVIDGNAWLGRWPFRRVKGDEPADFVAALGKHGVSQAWVGSFDGLFHRDVASVNARLAEDCRRLGNRLVPFGTVNPALPDWEEDLRRCAETHRMAGIRLAPGYHGYKLTDPAVPRLLAQAAERHLIVQLVAAMEDERTQHPVFRVAPVDLAPLAALVKKVPKVRLVLLNIWRGMRIEQVARLIDAGQVHVEIAMLEGAAGIARLLEQVKAERVLFGSHYPLFYRESAWLKLREADLPAPVQRAVCEGNARKLLGKG